MKNIEHVYEICDVTNDEIYYVMGVFINKKEAIAAVESALSSESPLSDYADEYEKIEIRKYSIGLTDAYEIVYTIERTLKYDSDTDKEEWVNSEITGK